MDMKLTSNLYKNHKRMIEGMAYSYSKTTQVEPAELCAYAWGKIAYAVRFYQADKGTSEKTFINMVARSAMNEVFAEMQKDINKMACSYEDLTSNIDDEGHDNSAIMFTEQLSTRDNYTLAELSIDLSEKAFEVAKAIVEEGLESKAQIKQWCKAKGFRNNEISYVIFEIGLVLTGRKIKHA